jgi:hypothetical protein
VMLLAFPVKSDDSFVFKYAGPINFVIDSS